MPPVHIDLPPLPGLPRVEPARPPMSTFSAQRFNPPMPLRAPDPLPRTRSNELEAWPPAIRPRQPYPMALYALSVQLIHGDEEDHDQYLWVRKVYSAYKTFVKHIRTVKDKMKDGVARVWAPGFDMLARLWNYAAFRGRS